MGVCNDSIVRVCLDYVRAVKNTYQGTNFTSAINLKNSRLRLSVALMFQSHAGIESVLYKLYEHFPVLSIKWYIKLKLGIH